MCFISEKYHFLVLFASRDTKFNLGKIEQRHFDPLSTSRQAPGEISQTGGAGIFGLFSIQDFSFRCAEPVPKNEGVEMTPYFELLPFRKIVSFWAASRLNGRYFTVTAFLLSPLFSSKSFATIKNSINQVSCWLLCRFWGDRRQL